MTERSVVAVVLAAGQGTRMRSALPKVLFPLAGRPMIGWVLEAVRPVSAHRIVVVGHGRDRVEAAVARLDDGAVCAVQDEPRGTGDALRAGLQALADDEATVLVLYGDCPLLRTAALEALLTGLRRSATPLAMLVGRTPDPRGYGRIVRDGSGRVVRVVEERDATPAERALDEVNPGLYAATARFWREAVARLRPDNAKGELYLTDVVAMAAERGGVADVAWPLDELRGVNDRAELARAEAVLRRRIHEALARDGVTIRDLDHIYVDADVRVEPEAVLEPGVVLRGRTVVGARARIDVGSVLEDVVVEPDAVVLPYTVATRSRIGAAARIGPFSHLRPETDIGPEAHVGNFVETKKTRMGRGSKANHLAYLGDGVIGENANVGAGTIFCNYDGVRKHTTVVEDGAFIGSDSQLVAPVTVGRGAYVASGTTVTRDVPPDALAISRVRQENKEGYARRLRARLGSGAGER
ncbi:MAG: bifunctional UDP-N-acetylglucosamine diphosphorylase/glucosamine-1-phosphate N-acetyltransferase GlmU [Myxococcota bacterium]|nr:bifunctional UDP-N-acetylglucosamine diphosphorylase/glucosamine-1-phosphate N-acetyltransferase GlmU [Myxococcota bacterium]MDW8363481.1 bifunctional UDP-N-acetylglucosamine diphosphorylase/glucosamine-1-phosphate N-acetyltransferase GlmU [Myxococcales bacterium]